MFSKKRIVCIRQLGGIGDVLMMSCVYRGLKEKYPRSKIQLLTGRVYLSGALVDVAERNPFIDEVHIVEPYDGTTLRTKEVWNKYYGQCPDIDDTPMLTKADLVIDLNTACVDFEWVAGRVKGGIKKPRYQIWCEKAGVVPSTYAPVYVMTDKDKAFAEDYWAKKNWTGKTVVGVGVAACDSRRTLGIGHVHAICKKVEELGYTPVVIDATFNFDDFEAMNGLRISEVMAVVAKMNAVVSPDTGLLHMAGTVKTPVVGLFGPTDQAMRMGMYMGSAVDSSKMVECAPCWYDYPCLKSHNTNEHYRCVKKIDAGVVAEEVRRWVERTRNKDLTHLRLL